MEQFPITWCILFIFGVGWWPNVQGDGHGGGESCMHYDVPGSSDDHSGKEFVLMRQMYNYAWDCDTVTNFAEPMADAFEMRIDDIFQESEWYEGASVRTFFSSSGSLGVDFTVDANRKLSHEEKTFIGTELKLAGDNGQLDFEVVGISITAMGLPEQAFDKEDWVTVQDTCSYFRAATICKNDGVCTVEESTPVCLCVDNPDDKYCDDNEDEVLMIVLIILCVIAGILLIILLIACIKKMNQRNAQYKKNPQDMKGPIQANSDPYSRQLEQGPVPFQPERTRPVSVDSTYDTSQSVKHFQPLVLHFNPGYDNSINSSMPPLSSPPPDPPAHVYNNGPAQITPALVQNAPSPATQDPNNPRYKVTSVGTGTYTWVKM